jgi:hypothetical protein
MRRCRRLRLIFSSRRLLSEDMQRVREGCEDEDSRRRSTYAGGSQVNGLAGLDEADRSLHVFAENGFLLN